MSTEITPPEAVIQPVPTQEAVESPAMTAPSLDELIAEANSSVPQALGDPVPPEATTPPEPAKVRTCKITDHFSLNFIELMKQAPNNPLTRAHMLKVLKQMPPAEITRFPELVDWVEFNFPPYFAKKPVISSASAARFELEFNVSRTDIGRASYRIDRSGTWTQSYSMDELREWIEENEDSFDDLQSRFYEKARDNESCDLEDSDGYQYSGHEDTDSDGTDLDLQGDDNDRRQGLLNFLRANGGEDLAQMLEDRG